MTRVLNNALYRARAGDRRGARAGPAALRARRPAAEARVPEGAAESGGPMAVEGGSEVVGKTEFVNDRIFRYTERISTKLESLESRDRGLSNGSNFVKIRSVDRTIRVFEKEKQMY